MQSSAVQCSLVQPCAKQHSVTLQMHESCWLQMQSLSEAVTCSGGHAFPPHGTGDVIHPCTLPQQLVSEHVQSNSLWCLYTCHAVCSPPHLGQLELLPGLSLLGSHNAAASFEML